MKPPIGSSPPRVRLLLYLCRERPAGKGALGHSGRAVEVRRSPWGTILMWVNAIIIQTHSLGRGISCSARTMSDTVGITEFFRLALLKSAVYQIMVCWYSLLHTKHAHFSIGAEMFSSAGRMSSLKFEFCGSSYLWLTGEWAIGLHQKVQPDNLIWQPSSDQTYFFFRALNHLD